MVRLKQRYLLLEILYPPANASKSNVPTAIAFRKPTPDYVDAGRFVAHLRTYINLLFGDYGVGVSASSLKVIYISNATSTIILRVPRNHHKLIWAALSHVTGLPPPRKGVVGDPCIIRVVRVSGTIRKAEEELLRRARQDIVRAKLAAEDQQELSLVKTKAVPVEDTSMLSIEDLSGEEDLSD